MKILTLILFTIWLTSCDMPFMQIAPDDFAFHPKADTTASVVVIDTCEMLINYSDTPFVQINIFFFNGKPDNVRWKYGQDGSVGQLVFDSLPLLLDAMYQNQFDYTYYEKNKSVTVFVDGTENLELLWSRVWARDSIGQMAHITAYRRGFYKWGALEFDEARYEAGHRFNVRSFHFNEKNWTPDQNDQFARIVMHFSDCKRGEYRADFRQALGISQSVVDSAALYEWEFVLQ